MARYPVSQCSLAFGYVEEKLPNVDTKNSAKKFNHVQAHPHYQHSSAVPKTSVGKVNHPD